MKTMTCNQLGGACDEKFQAETFEEMAELSKNHGMENMGDQAHQEAMNKMMVLMQRPTGLQEFMDEKEALFNSLNED